MRTLGAVVLFALTLAVGAWAVYHCWKWLEVLSEGQATWDETGRMLVALAVLVGAVGATYRIVEWVGSESAGAPSRSHSRRSE